MSTLPDPPVMSDTTPPPPSPNRLSLPASLRILLLPLLSSTIGFGLGLSVGGTSTGMRFRAENAHRLPTTQTGWYLYHKSKNYHIMLGGVKEGFRMAGRLGVWTGVFLALEEAGDRGREAVWRVGRNVLGSGVEGKEVVGGRDFVSTVLAGLGTSGLFSLWQRFPLPTAVRVAKMGAKAGLVFGVLQDGVAVLRGRRLGYVEFIKRHTFGTAEDAVGRREGGAMKVG